MQVLLPRMCAGCGGDVEWDADTSICGGCWGSILHRPALSCVVCDMPLPGGGARCADCRRRRRAFRALRCLGPYEGPLGEVLRALKYRGRADLARPLGVLLAEVWRRSPLGPADFLVPVPMDFWRRHRRGYNQAALIAREASRVSGVPLREDVLRRRRGGPSQTALSREARADNVRDVFSAVVAVRGKTVVLLDDICTTGATLEACARALKSAGAVRVTALAAARQPLQAPVK